MKQFAIGTIIGAAIMFFCMRSCNEPQPIDTHVIDSLTSANHALNDTIRSKSDSLQELRSYNDSVRNVYSQRIEDITSKGTAAIVRLTFERNKYRNAAEAKDTAGQISVCAEFMRQYDSAYSLLVQYHATVDSLTSNATTRRSLDSANIAYLLTSIDKLNGQISAYQKLLTDALADNTSLRSALARSKRGKWILAAAGLIGGGLLGHGIK